jgi:hypothetical protein
VKKRIEPACHAFAGRGTLLALLGSLDHLIRRSSLHMPYRFLTISEIRLANARALCERLGTTAFGSVIGYNPSRANQVVGPNPRRNIGDSLARKIEKSFHKPRGWLDMDHAAFRDYNHAVISRISTLNPPLEGGVEAALWSSASRAAIEVIESERDHVELRA